MTEKKADLILEKLDKIELLLFGNGKKGLFERVRNLEIFFKLGFSISFVLNILFMIDKLRG